ncbi:hypothetical protein EW145_g6637 [Phellinidium pouzarii]|uniref:G-protein coupled receptors family 1 profile domain-containing protein n=1 Tax=Phellinidium pouzarii TaxID=167371 RepID=A0A4S4KX48_9AGAM|nr:hypothetical protein EW145_g6637 [Phellinidium pouzarii]
MIRQDASYLPIADLITVILIDYILLMRVVALFSGSKKVAVFLRILLALDAASGVGLLIYANVFEEVSVGGLPNGFTLCGKNNNPPLWVNVSWAIPLLYGLILMILALYKAAEYWKMSAGFRGFELVKVLIRDQVVYFFLVIFCCVARIIAGTTELSSLSSYALSILGSPGFLCVLGSRLLVDLKEAGEKGLNGGISYRAESVSDIEFS